MKLLVALDLSDATAPLLREAHAWALGLGAQTWLVHVASPDPDFVGYEIGPDSVRDAVARQYRREHAQLADAAADFREGGVSATALLLQGATADAILREAQRLRADAIAMGAGVGQGLRSAPPGRVARDVLKRASCPVLLVPAPQKEAG